MLNSTKYKEVFLQCEKCMSMHKRSDTRPPKNTAPVQTQARSPRMRRANCMSFGIMETRLAWMAHKLVSSKSPTR